MKKIIYLSIIIITIIMSSNIVYAESLDDTISSGDNFIEIGKNQSSPIDETALQNTSDKVFNMLFPIAVAILFGVGMIIGIKFITGSVDEQAKIKEILIPYTIGAVVIFGTFTIWKIVVSIMQTI